MTIEPNPWQQSFQDRLETVGANMFQAAIGAKRIDDREMLIRALRYVLDDDPTGIPRASSYCQFVIRKALEAVGETA